MRRALCRGQAGAVTLAALACCSGAGAQYRADDHPVLQPPPVAAATAPAEAADTTAADFARAYAGAGRPRILLMWNRELDDAAQAESVERLTVRESGSGSASVSGRAGLGPGGMPTRQTAQGQYERNTVVTAGRHVVKDAPRRSALSERDAAMLQRAFSEEMGRGGVRFVDRALVMRTTAATHHRAGGDPKLIETDALLAHGELMLEVLLVADDEAPLGAGFDVRAKALQGGGELLSIYTRAAPPLPPPAPGRWVAGASGYEFQQPAGPPPPTPGQVGVALAREVMRALGANLEPKPVQARSKR